MQNLFFIIIEPSRRHHQRTNLINYNCRFIVIIINETIMFIIAFENRYPTFDSFTYLTIETSMVLILEFM